jgi:polyphosphate kinase 2 (PPK2 family)
MMADTGKKSNDGDDKGNGKLTTKKYDKQLAKLHVELVKLQEWVKEKGTKICLVFEGRDGAGSA